MREINLSSALVICGYSCTSVNVVDGATNHFPEDEVLNIIQKQNDKKLEVYRQDMERDRLEYKAASQGSFSIGDTSTSYRETVWAIENKTPMILHCSPLRPEQFNELDSKYKI